MLVSKKQINTELTELIFNSIFYFTTLTYDVINNCISQYDVIYNDEIFTCVRSQIKDLLLKMKLSNSILNLFIQIVVAPIFII